MTTRKIKDSTTSKVVEAEVVEITNAEGIPQVSTDSPTIVVHRIPFDTNRMLIRRERILLPASKSECGKYFTVESEDLDMSLSEESMEELQDAFESVLAITWELYVMGDPQKMTIGALELRDRLNRAYRLV